MNIFTVTDGVIDTAALRAQMAHPCAGGTVIFEGVVRNHHQGRDVRHLDYQGYVPLALTVGNDIFSAARIRWQLLAATGCHRLGHLEIGDAAVWIGVAAAHRGPAFEACAWIMDEIKQRVPIWKRETFTDGVIEWSQGTTLHLEEAI